MDEAVVEATVAAPAEPGSTAENPTRRQLWRITDRATFAALRRHGVRARRGPIALTWLAPGPTASTTPPRVAFAVGRATGGAVARNRIRRRLRAALAELQRAGRLPAGTYQLTASADTAGLAWPELVATLDDAVAATAGGRT